jgi:hypothetical protein
MLETRMRRFRQQMHQPLHLGLHRTVTTKINDLVRVCLPEVVSTSLGCLLTMSQISVSGVNTEPWIWRMRIGADRRIRHFSSNRACRAWGARYSGFSAMDESPDGARMVMRLADGWWHNVCVEGLAPDYQRGWEID